MMQIKAHARPLTLFVTLALLALTLIVVVMRMQPPGAKDASTPPEQFSAVRAAAILADLLGEESPHPVGTAKNQAVAEAITAKMSALGYQVEEQETTACQEQGPTAATCAHVKNLIAKLPGLEPRPALLYMAHYDSVGAGPGAADDLSGVVVMIENARIMMAHGPYQNPVIFLFTDAEEIGLVGAQAFVDQHPLARNIGAVINLEARGNRGQSLLFETSNDNAWLVAAVSRSISMPITSSLFYEIYRILPNDTDFTVFKRAGIPGINFGFIENSQHYHRPQDNLANLNLDSVQHHGENSLAIGQELADLDLANPPAENAIYIDLLGYRLAQWRQAWNIPLALLAMLVILASGGRLIRQKAVSLRQVLWGLLSALIGLVLAIVVGFVLALLIQLFNGAPSPWYAAPLAARLSFWCGALLSGLLAGGLFTRRAGWWGLGFGAWLLLAAIGLLLSFALAGASAPFLAPVFLAAVLLAIVAFTKMWKSPLDREVAIILAALFGSAFWITYALRFETAVTLDMHPAVTLWIGIIAGVISPLLALPDQRTRSRRSLLFLLGGITIGAAVAAIMTPPYSESRPQPLNINHFSNRDQGTSHYVARLSSGDLPSELAENFDPIPQVIYPWSDSRRFIANAPQIANPAPEIQVRLDEPVGQGRQFTVSLHTPRGGAIIELYIPTQSLVAVRIDEYAFQPNIAEVEDDFFYLECFACDGQEVIMTFADTNPVEVMLLDYSLGLPLEAGAFAKNRPLTAAPYSFGDLTLIFKSVILGADK